jgi:hypothetical protein
MTKPITKVAHHDTSVNDNKKPRYHDAREDIVNCLQVSREALAIWSNA